jgi:tRNA1Val (adenine37-N6)-methyltransferase
MGQGFFQFKQFRINQEAAAMKVTTDACLFGAWIKLEQKPVDILDIGTGTGLLSLMCVQNHPQATIDAVEIDEQAFRQAGDNFRQSPFNHRLHAIYGDINSISLPKKYDVIISNPPFYEREIPSSTRTRNVAHHSDSLLLTQLMPAIKDLLHPGGKFFLLLPYKRNEEIKKLLTGFSFHIDEMVLVRQTVNHAYFRIMIKGSLDSDETRTIIDELAIKDANNNYTPEFTSLLKPFYLIL